MVDAFKELTNVERHDCRVAIIPCDVEGNQSKVDVGLAFALRRSKLAVRNYIAVKAARSQSRVVWLTKNVPIIGIDVSVAPAGEPQLPDFLVRFSALLVAERLPRFFETHERIEAVACHRVGVTYQLLDIFGPNRLIEVRVVFKCRNPIDHTRSTRGGKNNPRPMRTFPFGSVPPPALLSVEHHS